MNKETSSVTGLPQFAVVPALTLLTNTSHSLSAVICRCAVSVASSGISAQRGSTGALPASPAAPVAPPAPAEGVAPASPAADSEAAAPASAVLPPFGLVAPPWAAPPLGAPPWRAPPLPAECSSATPPAPASSAMTSFLIVELQP